MLIPFFLLFLMHLTATHNIGLGIYWVEQLAKLMKNVKVNLHNKALGHYREMAWLPIQKADIYSSFLLPIFVLLCTHLFHFFPVSFHYLQCIHCLLHSRFGYNMLPIIPYSSFKITIIKWYFCNWICDIRLFKRSVI